MVSQLFQYFQQLLSSNSDQSSTRFVLIISLFMGFLIAIIGMALNKDLAQLSILVGAFTGPAALLKGYQKSVESK